MSLFEKVLEALGNKILDLHLEATSNEVNNDLHIL
jgi:hypothetical protein